MIQSTTIDCLARIRIIAQNFTLFRSNKTSKLYSDYSDFFFQDCMPAGTNEVILKQILIVMLLLKLYTNITHQIPNVKW